MFFSSTFPITLSNKEIHESMILSESNLCLIKDILELDLIKNSIKCLDINNEYIQLSCLRVIGNVEEKNILESSVLYSTQLKMKNRRLKKILPFLPSIMLYETIASRLLYVCKKMIDLPTTLEKIYRRKIIKK